MPNGIFGLMLGGGLLYALLTGCGETAVNAALSAAQEAISTALSLAGGFAFFCGMMNILRATGAVRTITKCFSPALRFLFGGEIPPAALEYVTVNLTTNMLGVSNAATPTGMKAARLLAADGQTGNALCLFLVINISSVQLLPTTVLALRSAAGSSSPGAVVLPTLGATAISTVVGILSCKLAEKFT